MLDRERGRAGGGVASFGGTAEVEAFGGIGVGSFGGTAGAGVREDAREDWILSGSSSTTLLGLGVREGEGIGGACPSDISPGDFGEILDAGANAGAGCLDSWRCVVTNSPLKAGFAGSGGGASGLTAGRGGRDAAGEGSAPFR